MLVETGHSNVKGNILKTVKAGYSEIWIVSNNPKVKITVDAMELGNRHSASIRFIQPTAILAKNADTS